MRAARWTVESLIATRATSAGVPIGLHAAKLHTRGEQPIGIRIVSSTDPREMIWHLAPSR
jgi:hypothetical protein